MKRLYIITISAALVAGCNFTQRVNVDSAGNEATGGTPRNPAISADGRYVAFQSSASTLVPGDTNNRRDIFVRDTLTGTTTRASVDFMGNEGTGNSSNPDLSADGRYVVFESTSNLRGGNTTGVNIVYRYDRQTGAVIRVSLREGFTSSFRSGREPAISADGRYVAFDSTESDMVTGDTNNAPDVFVRDTVAGTTVRVSVDSSGNEGNSGSFGAALSGDGRYVAFVSFASNLVAGDTNNDPDVFLHDLQTGTTTRVSVDSAGNEGSGDSRTPSLSGDGRYVAFDSSAGLVAGAASLTDTYLHDTHTGITTQVSVDSAGNPGVGGASATDPSISADGRYVAFVSGATNLVPDDTNGGLDIFVRDTQAGTTKRVSVDSEGNQANGVLGPVISDSGRYVAYLSSANNLVDGDTNGTEDIFLRFVPEPVVSSVIPDHLPVGATTSVTINGSDFLPDTEPSVQNANVTNVVIVDESTITMDVEVLPGQAVGARDLYLIILGTGPGLFSGASSTCNGCVTFQ